MLKKLKEKKYSFDIKTVIKTPANELKIINENLYVYDDSDSIKVYNCKTFKLKADLKLPLKGRIQRFDILENEVLILIYFGCSKLYYYKINLEEKQLTFMFYISEIYNYCYLKNRKEILLLQEQNKEQRPNAMAKTDLEGNITFYNEIKPKINDKFILPEPSNISKYNGYLCIINGLCNDKYIIIEWQHTIEFYDYKVQGYIPELEYSINIYNADNLNELLKKNLDIYILRIFLKVIKSPIIYSY